MGIDVVLMENNATHLSDSMKGNALEALVGAIYLEKGFETTRRIVVSKILRRHLNIHDLEDKDDNYKSSDERRVGKRVAELVNIGGPVTIKKKKQQGEQK